MSERVEWFRYRPGSLVSDFLRASILLGYLGVPLLLCAFSISGRLFLVTFALLALPLLLVGSVPFVATLITSADIAVTRDEVRLHVVGPWVICIPWDALRHATVWDMPPPVHIRATLLRRWDGIHTVYVPGLTVLTPVGLYYGMGRAALFVITPDHEGHERLLDRIRHAQHPLRRRGGRKPTPWRAPDDYGDES